MAGTLTLSGLSAGLLVGEKILGPISMAGTANIGTILDVALAAGDNTLAVPSGAAAFVIVLPATSTAQLKLRTNLNASDAGTPFGPTGWLAAPLFTGTTSLIINAAALVQAEVWFI